MCNSSKNEFLEKKSCVSLNLYEAGSGKWRVAKICMRYKYVDHFAEGNKLVEILILLSVVKMEFTNRILS